MSNDTSFEFDESQNAVLGDLHKKMQFVGMLFLIMGGFTILGGLGSMVSEGASGIANILSGGVYLAIGIWTRRAAASFREIVDTEGSDIDHLMSALGQLLNLYRLQYWMITVLLVVVVLSLVAGIFMGVAAG